VTGVGDNVITTQDMYRHDPFVDRDGKEVDRWMSLGLQPHTSKLEPFRQFLRDANGPFA